jgi:hypothetical protein
MQGDILKVGRIKFAVKEIKYREKMMDIDQASVATDNDFGTTNILAK